MRQMVTDSLTLNSVNLTCASDDADSLLPCASTEVSDWRQLVATLAQLQALAESVTIKVRY